MGSGKRSTLGTKDFLVYRDSKGKQYSAEDGRKKFFPFEMVKPGPVDKEIQIIYDLCDTTDDEDTIQDLEFSKDIVLMRVMEATPNFKKVMVCDRKGRHLGIIDDQNLAYYLDLNYVTVEKVEVARLVKAKTVNSARKQSPQLNIRAVYTRDGNILEDSIRAAGPSFYLSVIKELKVGSKVKLCREKENEYSANAIAVCNERGEVCGHIPEYIAEEWAPLMDFGRLTVTEAEVEYVTGGGKVSAQVRKPAKIQLKIDFGYDSKRVFAKNYQESFTYKMKSFSWENDEREAGLFACYKESVADFLLTLLDRTFEEYKKFDSIDLCRNQYRLKKVLLLDNSICKLLKNNKMLHLSEEAMKTGKGYNSEAALFIELIEGTEAKIVFYCDAGFAAQGVDYDEMGIFLFKEDDKLYLMQALNWYLLGMKKDFVHIGKN